MIRALYTAASGMSAQQLNLDTIANNLANASTSGFRRRRLQFQDMVYQNLVTPGSAQSAQTTSAGLQVGLGTKSTSTEILQMQGDLTQTNNPLDLAIEGNGFFAVTMPNGTTAYTRDGSFHLNNQGQVVTADGNLLQPAIAVPPNATSVTVSAYGVVTASVPGQTAPQTLGQLMLYTFPNPGGLDSVGANLMTATQSSGDAISGTPGGNEGLGQVQQGYIESSNVNAVEEFVQMILAQRAYESNSKVVKAADDMLSQVNQLGR